MKEQSKIEETIENIKDYANTQYELLTLKGSDKLAHICSSSISMIPVFVFSILTLLMLSLGLALYLNKYLISEYAGFLVVGCGYFVIVFFIILFRKKLIAKPLRNLIIRELFKERNNNI